jgi:hypothetical protein
MKAKIYATGNENIKNANISYYVLEKDKYFLDWLSKLLRNILDLDSEKAKFILIPGDTNKSNSQDKIYEKEVKKMIDIHEKYGEGNERADIFYGKNKVFLTIRTSKDKRKKLSDFIRKTKSWVNIKKTKKVPDYAKLTKKS